MPSHLSPGTELVSREVHSAGGKAGVAEDRPLGWCSPYGYGRCLRRGGSRANTARARPVLRSASEPTLPRAA